MKNHVIPLASMVLCSLLLVSCGSSADRSRTQGDTMNTTSNRVNTSTTPNRVNTTTTRTPNRVNTTTLPDSRRNNTASDPTNNTATSNRVVNNTSQNRVTNDPMTDPMHAVTTDRLQETHTSKDHLDDNATINRRNENTETVERMERRDDIHNATQDNKVQATAAANTRRTLYSHLSMSQDQIKQMESFQRDYNNQMSENTLSESQMDTEMRMDKNLKDILSEDQYRKYEAWKRENPNTRF